MVNKCSEMVRDLKDIGGKNFLLKCSIGKLLQVMRTVILRL